MISARWLEKRKPYWDRLEEMVERSGRRGLAALSARRLPQSRGVMYSKIA